MRGIPVRVEMGPRDIEANQAILVRRDTREKITVSLDTLAEKITEILDTMQTEMLERARAHRDAHTYDAHNYEEFKDIVANKPGFIRGMWCGEQACEDKIKKRQQRPADVCHLHRKRFQMSVYVVENRLRS